MEDWFNYSSGCWLCNEASRRKERTLPFNIIKLQEVAAKAINRTTKDVASFRKFAEGGFNRTFLTRMKDGMEVIARLPYPIAFPSQLAVASEVATLNLVKLYGVPVPDVLNYSTTKENPVGAEYIIMEKAQGEELGDRWFTLPDIDRAKLIGRLSQIEQRLFSIPLPASGSIFYKKDLDSSIPAKEIPGTEFCTGPSVEQRWWHAERGDMNLFRGPSGAEKELAWLHVHKQPRYPAREYREFTNYQASEPAEQMGLLDQYLRLVPHLVPTAAEHQYLLQPTLRHADINPRNIFVDKDHQISSLIDWQHCSAVPLFLQAGVPDCFANFGDEDSIRLLKPTLPEDLSTLSETERLEAIESFRRRHLHFYYFGAAHKFNNKHYKALRLKSTALKQRLCFNASAPWQGNNVRLKAVLIEAARKWDTLVSESAEAGVPCPISFSEGEATECLRINAAQDNVDEKLEILRDRMGISTDGWVPNHRYDAAVAENQRIKDELLAGATEEERKLVLQHWPFDDHAEDGYS
ncbi:kinase subdomain-containing protein [Pyrenochaeta sp. MPI-SDFR-AT-0127]|nr:kinase subdomain-containing protein [Pyrenochaeta sp. MPI-SDFR-AT-0127]